MTSTRTPKQKTISLTKQEAELLLNFRAILPEIQRALSSTIAKQAQRYREKSKPRLSLVHSASSIGGAHA